MSEPRRSTRARARAREEAAPAPETPKETPIKGARSGTKRKRDSIAVKNSTPSTPVGDAPQGPKQTLPLRIREGEPLPTLPEPQPLELSANEWQDIQQSGVLSASMERSRAVWVSGVNFRVFHKWFNQPKKPADRTDEDKARNSRQKELMKNFPELGLDPNLAKKDSPEVQAQLVIEPHTFPIRLYAPKESRSQPQKKPPTQPTYGAWPGTSQTHHTHPNQHTYNNHSQPVYQQKPQPPQPRPPPPKPVPKAPQPTPGPASTPAPDPVIHMLAQRAGVDPELKAVMKIVAAGEASKDQLEFFQTHINELTAVLAKQKETAAKAKSLAPSTTSAPTAAPPAPKTLPAPATPQPMSYNAPPPPTGYRPLVFSFEEGNKDLLHFPSYSFLEWLPNHSGAKISFIITKMRPKPEQQVTQAPSTPAPKAITGFTPGATHAVTPGMPTPNSTVLTQTPSNLPGQFQMSAPSTPAAQSAPQPRIEDLDEKNDVGDIEFYQPVTVLLLTDNHDVRHALTRAIRPPDVVERYMDEVFDKCKRAEETYLAFRLPRDGERDVAEKRIRNGDGTPSVATPTIDGFGGSFGLTLSGLEKKKAGRPRKSLV
ncbi:hypothetical protein EK21DRAFT_61207 [Setomelanomma holmii]|uniref:SWR1-complex protein 3 domain-containing protein n=1 Tax=Setomelanomma holmii TaxID=210430 RepID=A0A9P4HFG2_9PLEO|nr:hypothetical protein EK21DRAFT_61207 [Setomelanomma holmii]